MRIFYTQTSNTRGVGADMIKCTYRSNFACRMPGRMGVDNTCTLCLAGQQIESIELQTSAIMNLSMHMDERNIPEICKLDDEEGQDW